MAPPAMTALLPMLLLAPMRAAAAADVRLAEPISVASALQVAGALVLVLALLVVVLIGLRRLAAVRPMAHGRLRVLEGIAFGTRDRIVLMQIGAERLLIAVTPGRISTLHVLAPGTGDENETPTGATNGFAGLLRRSLGATPSRVDAP